MRADIARYVAPAAFLVAATAAILLIRAGLNAQEEAPARAPAVTTVRTTTTVEPTPAARRPRFTTVESGETLGSIADEFDTTVESLVELNPGVDPTGLTVGQRIRVR